MTLDKISKTNEGDYYALIVRTRAGYYSFFTGEVQNLDSFKDICNRWNLKVVAEQTGLTEEQKYKLQGYEIISFDDGILREDNKIRVGAEHLTYLTERLNQRENLDPQIELQGLVKKINQKP